MKNILKSFLIIIIISFILPSVALASWWNPFSWFNHWGLGNKQTNTELLEKRIIELENQINNESTTTKPGNKIDSGPVVQQKTQVIPKIQEANISSIVSDMYISTTKTLRGQIELLDMSSQEAKRYIDGIPRNVSAFKAILNTFPLSKNELADLEKSVEDWGNEYIKDFSILKSSIDNYSAELKKQNDIFISLAVDAKTKYIPKSSGESYLNDVSVYWDKIKKETIIFNDAVVSLSDKYLKDKNETLEMLDGYFGEYQEQEKVISNIPQYIPPIIPPPVIPRSVSTYCTRFGDSMTCNSYGY